MGCSWKNDVCQDLLCCSQNPKFPMVQISSDGLIFPMISSLKIPLRIACSKYSPRSSSCIFTKAWQVWQCAHSKSMVSLTHSPHFHLHRVVALLTRLRKTQNGTLMRAVYNAEKRLVKGTAKQGSQTPKVKNTRGSKLNIKWSFSYPANKHNKLGVSNHYIDNRKN